jgi:hypothetical protein
MDAVTNAFRIADLPLVTSASITGHVPDEKVKFTGDIQADTRTISELIGKDVTTNSKEELVLIVMLYCPVCQKSQMSGTEVFYCSRKTSLANG